MPADLSTERLESERSFHNALFESGSGDRAAQNKYYWSVEHAQNVFSDKVKELARHADVLEYGCGNSTQTGMVAPYARSVNAIDISDVAISDAKMRCAFQNVSFRVMDGMNMGFPSDSFDLVFGCGIVHHLDTELAAREISRVLRSDGAAVFAEPLGMNPIINAYRAVTPAARTHDEHPLLRRDFDIFEKYFDKVEIRFFGLTVLAAVPFRNSTVGRSARKLLIGVDRVLLQIPGVKWLAWYSVIECRRPKRV